MAEKDRVGFLTENMNTQGWTRMLQTVKVFNTAGHSHGEDGLVLSKMAILDPEDISPAQIKAAVLQLRKFSATLNPAPRLSAENIHPADKLKWLADNMALCTSKA